MQRWFIGIAALSGFLAVCLGAFAAHGLRQKITPELLAVWQTGVQYQMYHALALLFIGLLWLHKPSKALNIAGLAFIIGSFLFSGSLYALVLGAPLWVGIITPVGGCGFLLGWLALAYHAWRR